MKQVMASINSVGYVNQARGPSAAARQARGTSTAARQARGLCAAARQARVVIDIFCCQYLL